MTDLQEKLNDPKFVDVVLFSMEPDERPSWDDARAVLVALGAVLREGGAS